MLSRTQQLFPRANIEEVTRRARRVAPQPMFHLAKPARGKFLQNRFKEMGPMYSRVWVALGGQMRRRHIGRSQSHNDQRYYFRPLQPCHQRLYMSRLRQRDHSNPKTKPISLHVTNRELGNNTAGVEWDRNSVAKYGRKLAPPKRQDPEFRVF